MAVGCTDAAYLCLDLSESLQISWSIALFVLIVTLVILVYRVYLENTEYVSSLIQLNELRGVGNEASNATWRALSIGYSLSILLSGLSIDAEQMTFFRDAVTRDAIIYLLFLSRLPILIGSVVFAILTATTTLFRKRLAFSTAASAQQQQQKSNGITSFLFFLSVYLMSPFDLALVKMLPWRATEFTGAYAGYPSSMVLYLCVFSNLISISAQFVAATILLPASISGIRDRAASYYLAITGSLTMDEILYWLYLILTFTQFVGGAIYTGIVIHHTLTGKLQRTEAKVVESMHWQRLPTAEDHLDAMNDDIEAEIEFGTRNPVVLSSVTSGNLNKRNSAH